MKAVFLLLLAGLFSCNNAGIESCRQSNLQHEAEIQRLQKVNDSLSEELEKCSFYVDLMEN